MGILNAIVTGFKRITGLSEYIFVYHKNKEIICTFYNTSEGKRIIQSYLKKLNIKQDEVDYIVKDSIKDEQDEHEFNVFKVVMLNDEPMLYNEVVRFAKSKQIKGFDFKQPKYGLNKYTVENTNESNSNNQDEQYTQGDKSDKTPSNNIDKEVGGDGSNTDSSQNGTNDNTNQTENKKNQNQNKSGDNKDQKQSESENNKDEKDQKQDESKDDKDKKDQNKKEAKDNKGNNKNKTEDT
ncbi:hypothetical protein PV797_14480 [Clostridiaceae bacterium M8S5]|nr:hypothetical protein PV797_14480 [Clostridiaceae bacterium M8S5]